MDPLWAVAEIVAAQISAQGRKAPVKRIAFPNKLKIASYETMSIPILNPGGWEKVASIAYFANSSRSD